MSSLLGTPGGNPPPDEQARAEVEAHLNRLIATPNTDLTIRGLAQKLAAAERAASEYKSLYGIAVQQVLEPDRIVHASYPGMEIVRYDRVGKWYFEPIDSSLPRQKVTVKQAADAAVWARGYYNSFSHIFLGRHGGSTFDRLVASSGTEQDMSGYEEST